jgi:hypothetical protein
MQYFITAIQSSYVEKYQDSFAKAVRALTLVQPSLEKDICLIINNIHVICTQGVQDKDLKNMLIMLGNLGNLLDEIVQLVIECADRDKKVEIKVSSLKVNLKFIPFLQILTILLVGSVFYCLLVRVNGPYLYQERREGRRTHERYRADLR